MITFEPPLPHLRPVEQAGLTPVPAQKVGPPRVEECRAHLECRLAQSLAFGEELILLGEVLAVSIDRAATECTDPYAYLRPVMFLEGGIYGVIETGRRREQR